jgi:hypothetical protein
MRKVTSFAALGTFRARHIPFVFTVFAIIGPPSPRILRAQQATQAALAIVPVPVRGIKRVAPVLAAYFSGSWRCDGAFANGKPVYQSMEFHETLDGTWLSAAHDDRPPGTFHDLALWGLGSGGVLVAYIADNQGGMRRFVAAEGWMQDHIAFVRDTTFANYGRYGERFTYERKSDSTFTMKYATVRDTVPWHEGDHVTCSRTPR